MNDKLANVDNHRNDIWRLALYIRPKSLDSPPLECPDGSRASRRDHKCKVLASASRSNICITSDSFDSTPVCEIQNSLNAINAYDSQTDPKPVRDY